MRVFIILLLSFVFGHGHAQDYIVNVQQFGVEDGLAGRDVESIFIDKDGFLWIAGHDHFQRYDGYEFKTYDLKGAGGKVHSIVNISQDEDGWFRLLVGYKLKAFQRDILFFDPITGETLSKEEKLGNSIATKFDLLLNTHNFGFGKKTSEPNRFYFSGSTEIVVFDFKTVEFDTIPISISTSGIFAIHFIDHNSNFWITRNGDRNGKILKLDSTGVLLDSLIVIRDSTRIGDIVEWEKQLYKISNDRYNFSIGFGEVERKERGQDNLYKITENGNLETIFTPPFGHRILSFFDGRIWCINETGWKVYNLKGDLDFELKKEDYTNELFLLFNYSTFVKDKTGKIYFGSSFGLNIIELQKNPFTQYLPEKENQKLVIENSSRGIYASDNNVVVNFEFGGLVSIPKETPDTFTMHAPHSYSFNEDKRGMYSGRPLKRDTDGNYWIGEVGYIRKWSSDLKEQKKFSLKNYDEIWSLYIDENDCVWLGGNKSIGVICKGDTTITEYSYKVEDVSINLGSVYQLQNNGNGQLWLCTENGIFLFDKTNKKIVAHYSSNGEEEFYLPEDFVYYLHVDSDKNRWLGTSSGLVFWNAKTNEKRLFNRNDGLSNNVIYAIKEDDYGKLWLSSDYGIMSFDKKTFAVRTYLPKDGTSHHEFNRSSHFQSKDGTIYFGGLNGVTAFHPKDFIGQKQAYLGVAIADYEIFDGSESKLLNKTKELSRTKTITLHPSDRYFKLKFVLPTFDEVNKILYAWKMEGVYEEWNFQKENTLQFSALPYGEHTLRVKGQGLSGGWSPHELVLKVKVLKPFYLQIWFLISALLLLALGIWWYSNYRLNKLQKDKEKLEHEIEQATAQINEDKVFIEQQAEELKKLDKLKSRFFANVSHELRTPLSLMIGPIKHLLKNGAHSEKDRKLLEFVKRNSLHLKNLVNEILDLSKLENNKMELQETPVAFYEFIKDHMAQFYSFGNSESISFKTNFPESGEVNILLDKNKFEKVINNFLSNAMKFTPPGGKVNLTIEEDKTDLHLMVKDTGRGIHPNDLPHVFDRFYQSTQADAPTEGGTGIGLSLCWELAELMGGKVWAESILGEGSTFHLKFPKKLTDLHPDSLENANRISDTEVLTSAQEAVLETNSASVQGQHKQATILIAEDNEDLRAYYEILLSDYKVILTEHGQAALNYLQQSKEAPNLIISDLMMPVMDGMQFLTRLKSEERWRHIPVIMLTAKANKITKINALRIGIDDYMTKPFDDEELQVRVQNLLMHQRERAQEFTEEKVPIKTDSKPTTNTVLISEEDMKWLEEVEIFVKDHINDNLLSVNLLTEKFNVSSSTLLRQLRKITGLTPTKYIQEHRLNHARELLESRKYNTIAQVAYSVGFKDTHSFSRSFKQRFGTTPTELLAS